jgi:hypothetical protein
VESPPVVPQENAVNEPDLSSQSNIQRQKPTEQNTQTRELPQTAGELPLIALIGLLCLGAGLGLKAIRSNS